MKLARIQAASGALFALFLTLHLFTTSSATGGIGTYDGVLGWVRRVYRPALPVEIALIFVPATVHMTCGVIAFFRRKRGSPTHWRTRVHRLAGWLLLIIFAGHVSATRIMTALSDMPNSTGQADFAYLAYSVLNFPGFIKPYYIIFGTAGALHLCLGLPVALKILFPSKIGTRAAVRAGLVAAVLVVGFVLTGVISMYAHAEEAARTRFPEYRALYERYAPFMKPNPRFNPGEL